MIIFFVDSKTINFYFGIPIKDKNEKVIGVLSVADKNSKRLVKNVKSSIVTLSYLAQNKAQKAIDQLSKLPAENPNPILRFNDNFKLIYYNEASTIHFLSDFNLKEDKKCDQDFKKLLKQSKNTPVTFYETRNERHYSLTLIHFQEFNYINIYAADISGIMNQVNEKEKNLIKLKNEKETQKDFYEFILNNMPLDIAVFDKKHRYLYINPLAIRNKESRKFIIGKDDFDYAKWKGVSDEKAIVRRNAFNKILKTKEFVNWADEFIDKNGKRKIMQRSMGPLFDDSGEIRFVIGYGTDDTKRVLAEEDNVKLSLFAKNTNNGVLMLNKTRKIIWANNALLKRSGYSLSEVRGEYFNFFFMRRYQCALPQ